MAKSKYGFSSLKRAPPAGAAHDKSQGDRGSLPSARGSSFRAPPEGFRGRDDHAMDEDDYGNPEASDATTEEEERYAGIAAEAPVFLSPGESQAIRLFRRRVQEIAFVDPLMMGSSEQSIADYWIKGRYGARDVDASVMAYIAYVGLAVIRKEKLPRP